MTGGCGCGAVRFEVREPLGSAGYCHCTRCQRRSGTAASANAGVVPGSVHITAGEAELGVWAPAGGREKVFCRLCGSALFTRAAGQPISGVRLGAIDGDPGVRPQWHQYVDYAAPWEPLPDDGLPRHPEARPS